MPYIERDDAGAICMVSESPQREGAAFMPDDAPEIVAFHARLARAPVDFLAFMALFTPAEQAAIVDSNATPVRLFRLMAAGAGALDLADARVVAGLDALVAAGLISAERKADVLAGRAPD